MAALMSERRRVMLVAAAMTLMMGLAVSSGGTALSSPRSHCSSPRSMACAWPSNFSPSTPEWVPVACRRLNIVAAWLVLPIDRADAWEPAIVGSVVVVSLGRKLYSLATYSGPRGSSTANTTSQPTPAGSGARASDPL